MANIHRRIASPLVLELALDPGELAIEADSVDAGPAAAACSPARRSW